MVTKLLHTDGADEATIFSIHSDGDLQAWTEVRVDYPLGAHSPWRGNTVIAHENKLWWVDSTTGILCSDPFATNPAMLHVPLPEGIGCSQETLRAVVLMEGLDAADAVIKQWTLFSDQAGKHVWEVGFELTLAEVHGHPTYGLANGVPNIECIHPNDPNVVFFQQDSHLFGASLISGEMKLCQRVLNHDDEMLHLLVLPLNCKPCSVIPSPMRLTDKLSPGSDGFVLRTSVCPWHGVTTVEFYKGKLTGFIVDYSYVAAVHPPSGTFLICVGYHRESRDRKKDRRIINAYFLATDSHQRMDRLPVLSSKVDQHHGNCGLSVASSGRVCVAIFQPHPAIAGRGTAHYWMTGGDTWERTQIKYAAEGSMLPWHRNGVISQDSRLWWSDLTDARCLLSCDPFIARDQLEHIFLPEESQPKNKDNMASINFSCGMLRLAVVDGEPPIVKVWTLIGIRSWQHQYSLDFNDLWNNRSFITSGLPKEAMFLLLVHPNHPDVLYFLKEQKILAVSSTGHLLEEGPFELPTMPVQDMRCGIVHWCNRALRSLEHLPGLVAPEIVAEE